MSPSQVNTLIVALVGFLGALSSYLVYLTHQNHNQLQDTQSKIQELHLIVNSRLDQLVTASVAAAHAAGITEGQASTLRTPEGGTDANVHP